MEGQSVRLEQDPTQDTRDRYGRLLAYLWLQDGTFFNKRMIADGYALEYTYDKPYKYQADFMAAGTGGARRRTGLVVARYVQWGHDAGYRSASVGIHGHLSPATPDVNTCGARGTHGNRQERACTDRHKDNCWAPGMRITPTALRREQLAWRLCDEDSPAIGLRWTATTMGSRVSNGSTL